MRRIGRFWRTVKYLRQEQIFGRIWFKLYKPAVDLRQAPAIRIQNGKWRRPAQRRPSLTGPFSFIFLNEPHDLDDIGWDDPSIAKLWRYNLHYFDDLNAIDADARRQWQFDLVTRWLRDNPPARGTGWEPYPTSLRIVNWCKWILGAPLQTQIRDSVIQSLAVQSRWLRRRLERHLLGNHLLVNAKALVFAGLFFSGGEAKEWLRTGCSILQDQLAEQVLEDGGHFERSPMYHALVLEDVLDVINVLRAYGVADWRVRELAGNLAHMVPDMLQWLRNMCHPDGEISFFNDAAIGIAPSLASLENYAARLGISSEQELGRDSVQMRQSGYLRLEQGDAVVILDVAPIGPDYLPGHAHADTLSFELSLFGKRVIVNGGTSCYGVGQRRLFERSTSAHSTVEIDGQDSSEVWSGFRVGRRARPFDLEVEPARVACAHDGYRYLPGAPIHRREWELRRGALVVKDVIVGSYSTATARYLLHPSVTARLESDCRLVLELDAKRHLVVTIEKGSAALRPATYAPEFGLVLPTQALEVRLMDGRAITSWNWNRDAHPVYN